MATTRAGVVTMNDSTDGNGAVDPRRFSGKRAQRARQAAGKSYAVVAGEIGRHQTTIRHWERGNEVPPADILPAYARALDVDVEELLDPPPRPVPYVLPDEGDEHDALPGAAVTSTGRRRRTSRAVSAQLSKSPAVRNRPKHPHIRGGGSPAKEPDNKGNSGP
jgi:transcriptional regulator with XRE-family HTH domain